MRRFAVAFLLVLQAGCSDDKSDTSSSPGTVSKSVGPEGGTIDVAGATVTIPPNALSAAVNITISASSAGVPDGFEALSQVFHCEPSGTNFAQPVTMKMPFTDDGKPKTMFWTAGADTSFQDVGGSPVGTTFSATVLHFSGGFVGRKK